MDTRVPQPISTSGLASLLEMRRRLQEWCENSVSPKPTERRSWNQARSFVWECRRVALSTNDSIRFRYPVMRWNLHWSKSGGIEGSRLLSTPYAGMTAAVAGGPEDTPALLCNTQFYPTGQRGGAVVQKHDAARFGERKVGCQCAVVEGVLLQNL